MYIIFEYSTWTTNDSSSTPTPYIGYNDESNVTLDTYNNDDARVL